MNKEEVINKINEMTVETFFSKTLFVQQKKVIELIEQLDEPEAGHADEAPRYVKNILARLRELPLHDREVWLKAIMSEFERDFSRAIWHEGYKQGKFEGMLRCEKVTIPQFVADWIKVAKPVYSLSGAMVYGSPGVNKWLESWDNQETFARAWLDGYEVKQEKRYKVVMPNVSSSGGVLTRIKHDDSWIWIDTLGTIVEGRTHTRKELEEAGFGWVFDCPGIEIEEV